MDDELDVAREIGRFAGEAELEDRVAMEGYGAIALSCPFTFHPNHQMSYGEWNWCKSEARVKGLDPLDWDVMYAILEGYYGAEYEGYEYDG